MHTIETPHSICERCGAPAQLLNQGQPFCNICWAIVEDSWSCCLDCGQVFETPEEHGAHVDGHWAHPIAGELHYARVHQRSAIA